MSFTLEQIEEHRQHSKAVGLANAKRILRALSLTEPRTKRQIAALAGVKHGEAESGVKRLLHLGLVAAHKRLGIPGAEELHTVQSKIGEQQ